MTKYQISLYIDDVEFKIPLQSMHDLISLSNKNADKECECCYCKYVQKRKEEDSLKKKKHASKGNKKAAD